VRGVTTSIGLCVLGAGSLCGCYGAHERGSLPSRDAGLAIDAASPRDADAPDAAPSSADTGAWDPSCAHLFVPSCVGSRDVYTLTEPSCERGGSACRTFEVGGDDVSLRCEPDDVLSGPGVVRLERCAAGTESTWVSVTVLEDGSGAGVLFADDTRCRCATSRGGIHTGDVFDFYGHRAQNEAVDTFQFIGAGARYRVVACAFRGCR
jgi:hypothetical protein